MRFTYPEVFKSLEDYSAYRGQIVKILRRTDPNEYDYEGEYMYDVQAEDGWQGHAWRSELEKVK